MNGLHVRHFEFMQDNFADNITFIELGKLIISFFVLFPLMMGTEKLPLSLVLLIVGFEKLILACRSECPA